MTNSEAYIATINCSIETFNQNAKVNVEGLKARGEIIDDPMKKMFKSYQVASDTSFVRYTKTKKEYYDNG